ncbi:MAG: SHOCT domain-containing protein [Kangiellaceae bacterium]|nr:SHOCT domain-containing protein [Kangiellaceae bacterium]
MSDWDFLHEMKDEGYSSEDIADAAASGASPRDWEYIAKQEAKVALEELKQLRDSGGISRDEFKKRKSELLGA